MTAHLSSILYPTSDLEKAKAIFTTLLGAAPTSDSPYYVGYEINGLQVGLVPGGHRDGVTGPLPYYGVEHVEQAVADLEAAGAEVITPATQVAPDTLIAVVQDAEGNAIGLIQQS